jgi:hypothetical protein
MFLYRPIYSLDNLILFILLSISFASEKFTAGIMIGEKPEFVLIFVMKLLTNGYNIAGALRFTKSLFLNSSSISSYT